MKLSVGSLFSGIGGIELGFERTGKFETKWFVECEPFAQAVLRKHWPSVPIYGDIRQINFKELEPVDVLTGGFPCQDISNAGKRKGITGERSGLWKEYLRAISEIRPRYAFIENVSALRNRGLETVLCDLASIGYDAEWHCVPASSIGAPHRRDRIYILAMENSKRNGSDARNRENEFRRKESEECSNKFISASSNVADTNSEEFSGGKQNCFRERQSKKEISRRSCSLSESDYYYYWKQRKDCLREKNRRETWATDAGVLRVANGIPNRVHRIKCCGNGVVPQVAEFFAEMIVEKELK